MSLPTSPHTLSYPLQYTPTLASPIRSPKHQSCLDTFPEHQSLCDRRMHNASRIRGATQRGKTPVLLSRSHGRLIARVQVFVSTWKSHLAVAHKRHTPLGSSEPPPIRERTPSGRGDCVIPAPSSNDSPRLVQGESQSHSDSGTIRPGALPKKRPSTGSSYRRAMHSITIHGTQSGRRRHRNHRFSKRGEAGSQPFPLRLKLAFDPVSTLVLSAYHCCRVAEIGCRAPPLSSPWRDSLGPLRFVHFAR
jgi:hypothetical protein